MVKHDWGLAQPPHPKAPRDQGRPELEVNELPEVRDLQSEGWFLLPDAPMWAFLPAVWPATARTWVPDRSTHYLVAYTTDQQWRRREISRQPWEPRDYEEVESDINQLLRDAGMGDRPRDRIWLLKPPPGFQSLDDVLDHLVRRAEVVGVAPALLTEFVLHAIAEIAAMFEAGTRS